MRRLIGFIVKHIRNNKRYLYRYLTVVWREDYQLHALFFSQSELVKQIKSGRSLIRFGDGEIYIINYGSIHYQDFSPRLREIYIRMIHEYDSTSPYVLGIPFFVNDTNSTLRKQAGKLSCWLPLKVTYDLLFPKNEQYFDAHLFYRDGSFRSVLEQALVDKTVLVVTNNDNMATMKEAGICDHLNVEFLECPALQSFEQYDYLLEKITQLIGKAFDDYRVILSAGPASKALAYELSLLGIVSYDLGKGIEAVYRPNTIEHEI